MRCPIRYAQVLANLFRVRLRRILMRHLLGLVVAVFVFTAFTPNAAVRASEGQGEAETPSAKASRKKLQQKISLDLKEVGFKDLTEEIKREMDKPLSIKIDNTTGISNNSKVSYACMDKTVEQILNELADKYEFGWYVVSNVKDRNDGWIMIRKYKDKERGYEAGKEPKKEMANNSSDEDSEGLCRETFFAAAWLNLQQNPTRLRTVRREEDWE
jgi:hypothetical protein